MKLVQGVFHRGYCQQAGFRQPSSSALTAVRNVIVLKTQKRVLIPTRLGAPAWLAGLTTILLEAQPVRSASSNKAVVSRLIIGGPSTNGSIIPVLVS